MPFPPGAVKTILGDPHKEGMVDGEGAAALLTSGSSSLVCLADGSVLMSDIETNSIRHITCVGGCSATPTPGRQLCCQAYHRQVGNHPPLYLVQLHVCC